MNTDLVTAAIIILVNAALTLWLVKRSRRGYNSTPAPHRQRIVPQVAPEPRSEEHAKISAEIHENRKLRIRPPAPKK